MELVEAAPASGIWRLSEHGDAEFVRVQTHRRTVRNESEAFFLRISRVGDYFYEGADLGILVAKGRLMGDDFRLTDRAKQWAKAIRAQYRSRPLEANDNEAAQRVAAANNFKFL